MPTVAEMLRATMAIADDTVRPVKLLPRTEPWPAPWAVPQYAMRVGPGTDAVVWKICDTTETNEL